MKPSISDKKARAELKRLEEILELKREALAHDHSELRELENRILALKLAIEGNEGSK